MQGVSRLNSTEDVMLVSFSHTNSSFFCDMLERLRAAQVNVDMISQTPPAGGQIQFSFTVSVSDFDATQKTLTASGPHNGPMLSSGYTKINLFGEEMLHTPGTAATALGILRNAGVEIMMVTTSEIDISLLVRQEDADIALQALQKGFAI